MPNNSPAARKNTKTESGEKTAQERTSQALVKWCLALGVLSLVLLPMITLKLAAWKIRQERNARAAALLVQTPDKRNFGGPFSLTDHNGNKVTDKTYRGKYLLVYFGYTFCPDLCPTALQNITEALDELGEEADKIKVLFITIDPERDKEENLKEYVGAFHPNIVGLTGSEKQIAEVAEKYGVTYSRSENMDEGYYFMEHTNLVFILDPEGKPVASVDLEDVDPADFANALRRLWSTGTGKNGKSQKTG